MNVDLRPEHLHTLSLCSGGGGLDLGLRLAVPAARTVAYVEIEAYACSVLVSRMEEGRLDAAPLFSNLKTFDGRRWRGSVDCLIGGYPCQPFSVAGKMRGAADPRHLWPYIGGQRPEDGGNLIRDLDFPPRSSSSKTSPTICRSDSLTSPATYKRWVTTLRQACLQRRKSARPTDASGSSSWRSPDAYPRGGPQDVEKRKAGGHSVNLQDQATSWHTPRAYSFDKSHLPGVTDLDYQAKGWATPRAPDGEKGGPNQSFGAGGTPLPSQAVQWGTPTSRDWKDGSNPSENAPTNGLLGRQAPRMMRRGTSSSPDGPTSRLQLNPAFVEWLMGWETGWTVSASLAMASSPRKPRTPSAASRQTLKAA